MTKEQIKELENETKFKFFLLKFGVRGLEEYRTFNDEEKKICIEEYIKYKNTKKFNY